MMDLRYALLALVVISLVIYSLALVLVISRRRRRKLSGPYKKFVHEQWYKIEQISDKSRVIMEADKLLDDILSKKGKQGNLGDKLKRSEGLFPNIDAVWEAHKVRNKLAHEVDYKLSDQEADRVIKIFKENIFYLIG